MQSLIDHARTFPAKIRDQRQDFAQPARRQKPQALFISCSNSRVIPSMCTGARPGDICWLSWAEHRPAPNEPWHTQGLGQDLTTVTQLHVLTRLEHLRSYLGMARRSPSRRLRLHSWFHTVETDEVLAPEPNSRTFKPL